MCCNLKFLFVSMTYRHTYGMACDIRIWTKVYNIGEKFFEKKSIIYPDISQQSSCNY